MTYEYKCPAGHITERQYPIGKAKKRTACRVCGDKAEKIISQTSFMLLGPGWAKDGYK